MIVSRLVEPGVSCVAFNVKDALLQGRGYRLQIAESRNGRFCYMTGLGPFLAAHAARAGDEVGIYLSVQGALLARLVRGRSPSA